MRREQYKQYNKAVRIIEHEFKYKTDKGGKPYIEHLHRVSSRFRNRKHRIVGLLHDLVEDCENWNEDKLRAEFSDYICDAVICLTKKKHETYLDYLERVKSNNIAVEVKIADLEDNMDIKRLKEITDKDIVRIRKYHKAWVELTSLK